MSDSMMYPTYRPTNGYATAALALGIAGAVASVIPLLFFIAWACGAVGFAFGLMGLNRAMTWGLPRWSSLVGFGLSVVAMCVGTWGFYLLVDALNGWGS